MACLLMSTQTVLQLPESLSQIWSRRCFAHFQQALTEPDGTQVEREASDPEFSLDEEEEAESSDPGSDEEEEEEDSGDEGPSSGRIRPKRVRNDGSWEVKAMQEAETMIAAAEAKNKREADVGESVLHQVGSSLQTCL